MPIIGNDHQVMWRYLDYTSASGVWGNETWYASLPSNQTNIGMLSPSGDPSVTDMPHTYIAGDIIYDVPFLLLCTFNWQYLGPAGIPEKGPVDSKTILPTGRLKQMSH